MRVNRFSLFISHFRRQMNSKEVKHKRRRTKSQVSAKEVETAGLRTENCHPYLTQTGGTIQDLLTPTSKRLKMADSINRLADVRKSPNDTRNYRVIQLENGLTATLISDMKLSDSENSNMQVDGNENDPSDQGEKLSAAALCIGSGSFSDPPDIPGLAHFLEHMVFMGSEKYPDENEFDSFLKASGGGSNAFTDVERTVFYFDVCKDQFYDALDRFAHFFINPLMKQDSMDREIKAVDSEFDMALPNDRNRKEQLLGSLAKDEHPMAKFMWGSLHSLKTIPEAEGIDTYGRLQEFKQIMYSSHFMTLAVQSRDSLDALEAKVSEIFSQIPHNGHDQQNFSEQTDPFSSGKFCKLYKAIPVKNTHQVEITWSLPAQQTKYKVKPLHYLGWLVGHEGKGSILSYLKKKLWALSLDGGNSESGFEQNTTWSMFSVNITLTPSGLDNIYEVLTAVFQYLDMLRREGPQERIYKEIETIEANAFLWQEQCEPIDYVEKFCENMQLYPPEDFITGECLMNEYDPQLIEDVQNELLPSKASILLYSKCFAEEGICDQKETWFKTAYNCSDLPEEWIAGWQNLEPSGEFHMPAENTYIATDFDIKEADLHSSEYPVLLSESDQSKLWYKKDTKFNVPKGYVYFLLKSPLISSCTTPMNAVLLDLFVKILEQNLSEVAYAADVARLNYHLQARSAGFILKMDGFNHKLKQLFETIVSHIADFTVDEDLLNTMMDQQHRLYHNKAIKPRDVAFDLRLTLLQQPMWTVVDKKQCLADVTRDLLLSFVSEFKARLFVEGYVHGNFVAQEARDFEAHLLEKLGCKPVSPVSLTPIRVTCLPIGEKYCRVDNFNNKDNNSVITNYFQHGPANIKQDVINELLIMYMEEPVFNILRTREQLGYSVYCTNHNTSGVLGFSITVCSQADKFTMPQLNQFMEDFLVEFGESVDNLQQEEFDKLVQSLITLKKCDDTHMEEEASRYWAEMTTTTYTYNRLKLQIELLKNLTLEELQQWFTQHVPACGQHRKLSVQVIGSPNIQQKAKLSKKRTESESSSSSSSSSSDEEEEEDEDEDAEEDDGGEDEEMDMGDVDIDVSKWIFSAVEEDIKDKAIINIQDFISSQALYPVSKY